MKKASKSHILDTSAQTGGAQTLRRGLAVLRLLAGHHEEGMRASDVAAATGLERATAHRLLSALVEEGFAERDPRSRRLRLGLESLRLGLTSMRRSPLIDTCKPVMQRISRLSGDTTFLIVRQGDHSVCMHREEGPYPVRVFTTVVGSALPMGIGVGGLALLSSLPDPEIDAYLVRHRAAFEQAGLQPSTVLRRVALTRARGFSETVGEITEGVCGVGALIPSRNEAFAAIAIGAIEARLPPERRIELGHELLAAVAEIAT